MKDKAGNAALHLAFSHHYLDAKQVTAVLETGADPDIKDNPRETCLFAPVNKDTDIADLPTILLDAGIDLEAKDYRGRSALLFYAEFGRIDRVQKLLKYGAKVESRGRMCCTYSPRLHPLHWGEGQKHMVNNLEHCHLLAEAGADPLSLDEAGDTVLHDAAEFRDDDGKDQPLKVETLIKIRGSLTAQNHQGRTALRHATATPPDISIHRPPENA